MFRKTIQDKKNERIDELKRLRAEALNSSLADDEIPLSNCILMSSEIREKDYDMLVVCLYKYKSDKRDVYKTGFVWANVTKTNRVKPLVLWDKFGKFITDKELLKTYDICCIIPSLKDSTHSILSTYVVALQYAYHTSGVVLNSELIDERDVSLLEDDSDLKLYMKGGDEDYSLGVTTHDGILKGKFLSLDNVTSIEDFNENMWQLELRDVVGLFKRELDNEQDYLDDFDENYGLVVSIIYDRLMKIKSGLKNCNLCHIALLLEGVIKVRVGYVDDDDIIAGRTTCKVINMDNDSKDGTSCVEPHSINHLVLSLSDLKLCYHDRRVKLNLYDLDGVSKRKTLEGIILNGSATLKF